MAMNFSAVLRHTSTLQRATTLRELVELTWDERRMLHRVTDGIYPPRQCWPAGLRKQMRRPKHFQCYPTAIAGAETPLHSSPELLNRCGSWRGKR